MKIAARGLCSACYSRQVRGSIHRIKTMNKGKICKEESCRQPAQSKGYCMPHYWQKGQHPLKNIWKLMRSKGKLHGGPKYEYPPEWDNFEAFVTVVGERPTSKHQLRRLDPDKPYAADNVQWLTPLPGSRNGSKSDKALYMRAWSLRRLYKISVEEYDAMLAAQGGVCGSCGGHETFSVKERTRKRMFAVDHCHKTGKVRGLLCGQCNRGMGSFKEDPELLRAAADYLERAA